MKRMKGKVFFLSHGVIENDLSWNILHPRLATVDNKEVKSQWLAFPTFSVLIEHPKVGWILYDTGPHPDVLRNRLPEEPRKYFSYIARKEDFLEERLKSLGLSANDISLVIISHLHWDHAGNLYLFSKTPAGQRIIVGEEDLKMAFLETYTTSQRFANGYFEEDFAIPGIVYTPIKGDYEIAEGIEIISLGGHTPQVLGLVIHLEHSGTFILTSDSFPMSANFGPPPRLPGIIYDSRAFYASAEKIQKIQKKFNATVIHPHDPEQFSVLKHSPDYYD